MNAKDVATPSGPAKAHHICFPGERHFLFFQGWKIGYGTHVADGKRHEPTIFLTTLDQFVVTYRCHTEDKPNQGVGDRLAHLAASHETLEGAVAELIAEAGVERLVAEELNATARRDWPMPGG